MNKASSSLYRVKHPDAKYRIAASIDQACRQSKEKPLVFFRADDIGVPSHRFKELILCFQKHRLPLCLAVVPTWITEKRLSELRRITGNKGSQWCWHQHGRLHQNFEKTGKKQEFGPARTKEEIYDSLTKGKKRMEELFDRYFFPVFTPPWNRCSEHTLHALKDLDFQAVSRSRGARPETRTYLPDFQVGVDLHTRKEDSAHLAFENLLTEVEQGLASGRCGIMLHHQRMDRAALELLDLLLGLIKSNQQLIPVQFEDMLKPDTFSTL